jgi:hypothetical protein
MSEYPRTGMNKAILKFRLQGSKKSQIVSVIVTQFSGFLISNYCLKYSFLPMKQAKWTYPLAAGGHGVSTSSNPPSPHFVR